MYQGTTGGRPADRPQTGRPAAGAPRTPAKGRPVGSNALLEGMACEHTDRPRLTRRVAEGAPTIGVATVWLGHAIELGLRVEYSSVGGQHRPGAIAGPATRRFVSLHRGGVAASLRGCGDG